MQARFDQDVAPALTSHLRVPTGQNEGVIALLFSTDRVPYLVKTASGGSPEREIPIRDGTRTRSARRDELICILIPALMVPNVIILGANIVATWYLKPPSAPGQPADIKDRIDINGRVSFYVEHTSSDVIVIPGHEMAASLIFKEHEIPLNIFGGGAPKSPNPRWGVYLEKEDLICTAPGRTMLNIQGSPALEHYDLFLSATEATLSLTLGVAGGSRPIRATGKMPRQEVSPYAKNARIKTIGRWGIGNL